MRKNKVKTEDKFDQKCKKGYINGDIVSLRAYLSANKEFHLAICRSSNLEIIEIEMNIIKSEDFISSIAGSLQHISCYHPLDFVRTMYPNNPLRKSIVPPPFHMAEQIQKPTHLQLSIPRLEKGIVLM